MRLPRPGTVRARGPATPRRARQRSGRRSTVSAGCRLTGHDQRRVSRWPPLGRSVLVTAVLRHRVASGWHSGPSCSNTPDLGGRAKDCSHERDRRTTVVRLRPSRRPQGIDAAQSGRPADAERIVSLTPRVQPRCDSQWLARPDARQVVSSALVRVPTATALVTRTATRPVTDALRPASSVTVEQACYTRQARVALRRIAEFAKRQMATTGTGRRARFASFNGTRRADRVKLGEFSRPPKNALRLPRRRRIPLPRCELELSLMSRCAGLSAGHSYMARTRRARGARTR